MDIHFKNLSFPVSYWNAHEGSLRSLFRLERIGFIPRKTGWVRSQFDTVNFSLILHGGGEFHRKGHCWKVEAPCVITELDGDYLEYGPSEPHEYWTELYLVYSSGLIPRFVECGFIEESRPVWPISNPSALRPLLEELARCLATKEKPARIDRIAERIILETLLPPHVSDSSVISKAIDAIQTNWQSPPNLESLAGKCNMSVSTFQRRWNESMGITPARYALGLRLQEACRLLIETGDTISEVAKACGFDDEFYFSRCFRREFGTPPRSYRKEHLIRSGRAS
ncbi:MAG: helix-turn-helix domain-containing protein [Chthoniobacterales bacterium]